MGIHFPNPGDVLKKIEHGLHDAEHTIQHTADGVLKDVQHAADNARHEVEGVAGKAQHELEKVGSAALHDIDKARDAVLHDMEGVAKKAASELMEVVTAQALHQAVNVAEALAPDSFQLQIGPVVLEVDGIPDKVDVLKHFASAPPSTKADVKKLILALAPTAVGIQISVEFAALFVTSASLSVGFSATWQTSSFISQFEKIMADF